MSQCHCFPEPQERLGDIRYETIFNKSHQEEILRSTWLTAVGATMFATDVHAHVS